MNRDARLPKVPLAIGAFLLVAVVAYLPGLHGGFVYDDWGSITGNPDVQVTTGHLADWWRAAIAFPSGTPPFRSLTMLTFAVNHYFSGLDPFAFKLTNLAIHLLNGVLLFLALRALFALRRACAADARPFNEGLAAAAIAGLWLLLPINLTAVLYVVQRLESFAATFTFLGLAWYLHARLRLWQGRGGAVSLWASIIVCTGIGVTAKETAVVLPLYAALIEFCIAGGRNQDGRRSRPVLALYVVTLLLPFLVGLAWMWGRYLGVGILTGHDSTIIDRMLTEARVLVGYIGWTLLPNLDSLTLYHDDIALSHGLLDPPATLVSILALAALLGAALWQRRRRPLFALGILWFFAGQLLTATVIPLILAFEHRNYFPSAGLLLAGASLVALEGPLTRVQARCAAVIVAAVFYAGVTWLRANEWSDPLRLARSEAMKRPDSSAAQFDYAQALLLTSIRAHESAPANAALQVLDRARHLRGASTHFEQSMITLLGESGYAAPPDVWASLIDKLKRSAPDTNAIHAFARLNHCFMANQCKPSDLPHLRAAYDAALSHMPTSEGLLSVHAEYAWHVENDRARAEQDFREAMRQHPNDIAAQQNLIIVLIHEGKKDEAETMIEAIEARNRFGMLDGFIKPMRAALDSVMHETPAQTPVPQ